MENFTNDLIDTTQLPQFETVTYTPLHPNYWKVTLINLVIVFVILWSILIANMIFNDALAPYKWQPIAIGSIITMLILLFSRMAFLKKGFAFRQHDVLFRRGIIATNIIVIPYNRIQHVASHEGLLSRYFGLSKIEIFTAGASSSDIGIPGIEKEQAESIKQLLMGKIQKQL